MAKITDAVEILKRRMGIDPDTDPEMLQISEDLRVAQMIFDAAPRRDSPRRNWPRRSVQRRA